VKKEQILEWRSLTRAHQKINAWRSSWQLVNSFVPFIALWVLAYYALQVHFLLMLPVSFCAALFAVRIFVIQHDCGHGTFFKNRSLRDNVGFLCSVITMTPYEHWKWEHAQHHAHSGDLQFRDLGEIKTLTAQEFLALSRWEKTKYRIYRHPITLFFIGPIWVFFIKYRFPRKEAWPFERLRWSVWQTNVALLALFFWASSFTGVYAFLLIHGFTIYFTAIIGVWLFYVQHQFEDGYWRPAAEWNNTSAAVHGSSYFKLPKVLQWLSGNIGFHHIHHLNPLVPNYELESCHKANPVFDEEVTTLTLINCWETVKLKFWDEKTEKMITYRELEQLYI